MILSSCGYFVDVQLYLPSFAYHVPHGEHVKSSIEQNVEARVKRGRAVLPSDYSVHGGAAS